MIAAGDLQQNMLWHKSGSSRRYFGSIFATVLIEKLTRYRDENKRLRESSAVEDEEQEPTEEQTERYSTFSKSVYQTLLEEVVKRDPDVVSKRRNLIHAFGRSRDMSPAYCKPKG